MSVGRILEQVVEQQQAQAPKTHHGGGGRGRPPETFVEHKRFKGEHIQIVLNRRGKDFSMQVLSTWEVPATERPSPFVRVRVTPSTLTTPSVVVPEFTQELAKLMGELEAEVAAYQQQEHARTISQRQEREERRPGGPQQAAARTTGKTERERAKKKGKAA